MGKLQDFMQQMNMGPNEVVVETPPIICLCGSTKFKEEFEDTNLLLTMAGFIVISVSAFGHADGHEWTTEEKEMLDRVHKQKIMVSDGIFVVNKDRYIGSSTQSEIDFARVIGKKIFSLEPIQDGAEPVGI